MDYDTSGYVDSIEYITVSTSSDWTSTWQFMSETLINGKASPSFKQLYHSPFKQHL